MSGKLEGKIALVTGVTAGIGLATGERFVKEGAYVCRLRELLDRSLSDPGIGRTGGEESPLTLPNVPWSIA